MSQTLPQDVARWAARAGLGRPSAPALPRVWRFDDPGTGLGYFVFETPRGTVYQRRTAALSGALSALRMGELVVDEKAAREILGRLEEMDAWVRAAEDARRSNPLGAESSDLTASIEGYWAAFDRDRETLEGLKTKANKAILTRNWQSASDKDMGTLGAFHMMARELAEQAKAVAVSPPPGAKPLPVKPPETGGLSSLAGIGIGLAVVSAVFGGVTLVYHLTKSSS